MELETFVNHGNLTFSLSATQGRKKWLFSEVGSWLAPLEKLRRYSEIISGEMTIISVEIALSYHTHLHNEDTAHICLESTTLALE